MSIYTEIVNKIDNRKGFLAGILAILLILFALFFLKIHEPNPPKVDIPIPMDMEDIEGIDAFEIENGGASGKPASADKPADNTAKEETQEQPQQEKSSVSQNTGNGSSNTDNTSPSDSQSDPSPFSGNGGKTNEGKGTSIGTADNGPGPGGGPPGGGTTKDRIRLNGIKSTPQTPNSVACTISFILTVNSDGKVIAIKINRRNTNTQNDALINEVSNLIKKEVKYKPKPGAPAEKVYYTVNVKPS